MTLMRAIAAMAMGVLMSFGAGCGSSVTGSWTLDKDKTLKQVEAQLKEQMDDSPLAEQMIAMAKGQIEAMELTLEMNGDHTFNTTAWMGGRGQEVMRGTWKKDGSAYQLKDERGVILRAEVEDGALAFVGMDPKNPDAKTYFKKK